VHRHTAGVPVPLVNASPVTYHIADNRIRRHGSSGSRAERAADPPPTVIT